MNLSWWTTVSIMFGSNKRKMRRIQQLVEQKDEHWQKYLDAKQKLRDITGIP